MRIVLTAIAIFSTFLIQAQTRDGYVILNNGDTLNGQIDDLKWINNPEKVIFRIGGNPTEYKVSDLREFGAGNDLRYVRYAFTYQQTATELEYADETFDGPTVTTTAWLKVLYGAQYSLYEFRANRRTYFFYAGPDGQLSELIYRIRLTSMGELEKDEQYKNRLASMSPPRDAEKYQRVVNNASYTDDDLVKIFEMLNGGGGSFRSVSETTTKIDISGGANIYTFSPKGDIYNDGSGAYSVHTTDFKSTVGFVIGAGLTFKSNNNPKGVQSRIGVNIASVTIDGLNTAGTGAFEREIYKGTLIVAEPNASVDFPLSVKGNNAVLLGGNFGYNITVSNNFKGTFENPGVVIVKKNFPPVDGGFINFGLNFTVISNRHRFNARAFTFTNIFDSPKTNLKGVGFNVTYGFYVK